MSRTKVYGAATLAVGLVILSWTAVHCSCSDCLVENPVRPPEPGPLCPWREPEADLSLFFPAATRYETETRILSGVRPELEKRLGRTATGDENASRVYRVFENGALSGFVLTRRIKGEHGLIELVLAADPQRRVKGFRLQRLREPGTVTSALQDPAWCGSFVGKGEDSSWRLGGDIPSVPRVAQSSAEAIVEGTKSLLVLLSVANQPGARVAEAEHHH